MRARFLNRKIKDTTTLWLLRDQKIFICQVALAMRQQKGYLSGFRVKLSTYLPHTVGALD